MKNLIFILSILATLQSQANCGPDTIMSIIPRPEALQCTMHGHCFAYDLNPVTHQYEYSFGFHTNCEGQMHRTNSDYMCQRSDLSVYPVTEIAPWGACTLQP